MENNNNARVAVVEETLNLATWNMPRSIEQLRSFVSRHEESLDVEDFYF